MYKSGNISIDDHFARFGGKSFAINKINSVEVREQRTPGNKVYVIWWIIAAVLALGALPDGTWALLALAIFAALVGWSKWRSRNPVSTYSLYLVTSSSEAQACQTSDKAEVERLRDAVESAIARSS